MDVLGFLGRLFKRVLNPETQQDRDRVSAQQWARDLLSRTDWVILDTETTGLHATAEAIQIGVLGRNGEVLMDQLLRPIGRIRNAAIEVHGITSKDVRTSPRYPDVHPKLLEILRGRTVIAYNAPFDSRILKQTAEKHGVDDLGAAWECCMSRYSSFVAEQNPNGGYRSQKLPRGSRPDGELHGAIGDCRLTLDVIRLMAR